MEKQILKFSYYLQKSNRYYNVKHFIYQFLEDPHSKKKTYFDFMMIFLVLSTVGILIFEVNHEPIAWLNDFETIVIFIFILEWICRFWVISHSHQIIIDDYEKLKIINQPFSLSNSLKKVLKVKIDFVFSPMSIIDLLAILPAYRPLRILRILMLFRLFKLLRYANSVKQFSDVFIDKKFEFFTLSIMFGMAVIFGSAIIFIYEGAGANPNINSYFDAIYWSIITISTVGFGDISPVTIEGRIATIFLVIGGLSVIAFFTSIVTTALGERLVSLKEDKVKGEANVLKNFVLICGYGKMGQKLACEFELVNQKFIVIDINEEALAHATSHNILSIKGDATDGELLHDIGINKGASCIIALTNNDAVNLSIILNTRAINKDINIIARANDDNIKSKLLIAGANEVVAENEIAALVATEYLGQPIAFDAIDDILLHSHHAIMDEVELTNNSPYIGKLLKEIDFEIHNLIFIGLLEYKNNKQFLFNAPIDSYILEENDVLIVIGFDTAIKKLKIDLLLLKGKKWQK